MKTYANSKKSYHESMKCPKFWTVDILCFTQKGVEQILLQDTISSSQIPHKVNMFPLLKLIEQNLHYPKLVGSKLELNKVEQQFGKCSPLLFFFCPNKVSSLIITIYHVAAKAGESFSVYLCYIAGQ